MDKDENYLCGSAISRIRVARNRRTVYKTSNTKDKIGQMISGIAIMYRIGGSCIQQGHNAAIFLNMKNHK